MKDKIYDVWIDLNKNVMTVEAKNIMEALKKTKKELNKIIDSITEKNLEKKIDPDRGLYYYKFINKHKDGGYDETAVTIYDPLDYSYVEGKKWSDFSSYDLLNWNRREIEHLVTHGTCDCCDVILPKKDIIECWDNPGNSLENKCKEKGLNYEYLEDMSSICNKCIDDEKYMSEYNRIKEIEEEFKRKT